MNEFLKNLEKYLPITTTLVAVVSGILFLALGKEQIKEITLLWAIFSILILLAGTEGLKRLISTKNIEESLEEIKRNQSRVTNLVTREALYLECAKQMRMAQHTIYDTTWGKSPEITSRHHTRARVTYRKSVEDAINRGISFKEIFSSSGDGTDKQDGYLTEAINEGSVIKILKQVQDLPMFDFMVIDSRIVLFSRVYSPNEGADEAKYYLVEDEGVAKFFKSYFNDMWREAQLPEPEIIQKAQIDEVKIQ